MVASRERRDDQHAGCWVPSKETEAGWLPTCRGSDRSMPAISESSRFSSHREMPFVERRTAIAASFPSTASLGPVLLDTMNAKPSSSSSSSTPPSRSPGSPDAVSTLPSGRPPISPSHLVPRMSAMANGVLPSLVRLPSLTRTSQPLPLHTSHGHGVPAMASHRPSVSPTPQVQTRLTPTVPLPPSPPANESPSPRELAARLALLLHARECCTPLDMERVCGVRNCRVARGVLDHCQECFLNEGQCHRSCSEAKQLLRHFRVCRAQQFQRACAICDTLRTEFVWAMQHARSLTPLFVPRTQTATDQDDVFYQQQQLHQQESYDQPRRHSSFQPEPLMPTASLRRSVSEGPHATMSATGHHKRSSVTAAFDPQSAMEPPLAPPTVKRVRIVTPTEEAAAAAKGKIM